MQSLFEYFDYRDFLKDHYESNKRLHTYFSYRYITQKTGVHFSSYVKILNKQLHLSDKSLATMLSFLKLNKKECEYFTQLVRFNKAKQQDQIKFYFEKLIALREPVAKALDVEKYEFFSKWYYTAIRELLNITPFDGNYQKLAASLEPEITLSQAKKAVKTLKKLGLLQSEKGGNILNEAFISAGGQSRSVIIRNFQKEMLKLAGDALDTIPKTKRDFSTLTVSTSWENFSVIQERLGEVRNEIMQLVQNEEVAEVVFQINFQLFPLTKSKVISKPPKKGTLL